MTLTYHDVFDAWFAVQRWKNGPFGVRDYHSKRLKLLCELFQCEVAGLKDPTIEDCAGGGAGPIGEWMREVEARCRARFEEVVLHRYPGIEERSFSDDELRKRGLPEAPPMEE